MARSFLTPILLPADPTLALQAATKQYVDSKAGGGSVDEVMISATDPGAGIELWVDTSSTNLTDPNVARWNSAWGAVGSSKSTVLQNILSNGSTFTTLNNIAVTFTAVAGRKYAISAVFDYRQRTNTGSVYLKILDAVDGDLQLGLTWAGLADGYYVTPLMLANWTPSAGSHTVRLAGTTNGTSVDFNAYGGTNLLVEDVGPVSMSSPSPVGAAVGAWTPVTFLNGWINAGGGYQVGQYRLVGDMVQLRGRVQNGAMGTAMFNLPTGFRPPATTTIATGSVVSSSWAFGVLDCTPDGNVTPFVPGSNQGITLSGLSFSVSA